MSPVFLFGHLMPQAQGSIPREPSRLMRHALFSRHLSTTRFDTSIPSAWMSSSSHERLNLPAKPLVHLRLLCLSHMLNCCVGVTAISPQTAMISEGSPDVVPVIGHHKVRVDLVGVAVKGAREEVLVKHKLLLLRLAPLQSQRLCLINVQIRGPCYAKSYMLLCFLSSLCHCMRELNIHLLDDSNSGLQLHTSRLAQVQKDGKKCAFRGIAVACVGEHDQGKRRVEDGKTMRGGLKCWHQAEWQWTAVGSVGLENGFLGQGESVTAPKASTLFDVNVQPLHGPYASHHLQRSLGGDDVG
mmetsp:Transcript_28584/g.71969  ORF Transcript_28584/g.71969 Transcript_28584/m.71969 type:complete len:299 (-) Transcript_28584:641-1537(-)